MHPLVTHQSSKASKCTSVQGSSGVCSWEGGMGCWGSALLGWTVSLAQSPPLAVGQEQDSGAGDMQTVGYLPAEGKGHQRACSPFC